MTPEPLLNLQNLAVQIRMGSDYVAAVHDLDLTLRRGEIVGLVGESGCGKSLTAMAVMGLLRPNPMIRTLGKIDFLKQDLNTLPERQMRTVRGNGIGMIFQEPLSSLNPVFTIGNQIAEAIRLHRNLDKAQVAAECERLLKSVNIADPQRCLSQYPHELSGGMRQRVMIAMALSCNPQLLIADEPTTALDVTIQAQILKLLLKIRDERDMGILLITHDLGVVAQVCDRVNVMYAGSIVETGTTEQVLFHAQHPYTKALLHSMPRLGGKNEKLEPLQGQVPPVGMKVEGCAFQNRCQVAFEKCKVTPELVGHDHKVACWRVGKS